jgi:hypothetical protein
MRLFISCSGVNEQYVFFSHFYVSHFSGIPIFSIIARYNLVENRVCRKLFANFWAVVLPWVIAIPFYAGVGLLVVIK